MRLTKLMPAIQMQMTVMQPVIATHYCNPLLQGLLLQLTSPHCTSPLRQSKISPTLVNLGGCC